MTHDRRLACCGSAGSASTPARTSRRTACRPGDGQHLRRHRRGGAGLDVRRVGGQGQASLLGIVSGAVAGLVAITPAAGFAGPMGAHRARPRRRRRLLLRLLGREERARLRRRARRVRRPRRRRHRRRHRDRHPGRPDLGGAGIVDYAVRARRRCMAAATRWPPRSGPRSRRCWLTIVWSGVGSASSTRSSTVIVGLRVTPRRSARVSTSPIHGERAYNYC